jgi:hypothetical protein
VRDCLHIDSIWIGYADDFSNNLRTIFTIGEDNRSEVEGENLVRHTTPVSKSCLVGEADAWRMELVARIVLYVRINQ